jgi:transposase
VDVEWLIEEDHPARALWSFVAALKLESFLGDIAAVEGMAGRSAYDPHLLISLWLYAYSQGIGSAREVSRRCDFDPAFQWLTGLEGISYHTLSSFRVEHGEALKQLEGQVLGVLSYEGLIDLKQVMHDGSKIKANASSRSFRRQTTLEKHLERGRQQVEQLSEPQPDQPSDQVRLTRQRAVKERQQRLGRALDQLEQIRQRKKGPEEKQEARASATDPEARIMPQPNGGFAPSYNLQLSTDVKAGIIVGHRVSQAATDAHELPEAIDVLERHWGRVPEQLVVDGGFTNQETIEAVDRRGIELIGPVLDHSKSIAEALKSRGITPEFYPEAFEYDQGRNEYRCPAGRLLDFQRRDQRGSTQKFRYQARLQDCVACPFKPQCCPEKGKSRSIVRSEESLVVVAFRTKMQSGEAKAIYKKRSQIAEFPNAWIKQKIGLRQFRLRGLAKVGIEALWACLTYNIQQWVRLCWRPCFKTLALVS